MSTPRLSPTSYVVLGLVERHQPATPYEIKQLAELSTANFWSVPHTQLYKECARMAEAGLLDEEREEAGRRRRTYRLTEAGRLELDEWRREPVDQLLEVRDLGILKLFFGADPADLAAGQVALHEKKLAEYEQFVELEMSEGARRALDFGVALEKQYIRFWEKFVGSEG